MGKLLVISIILFAAVITVMMLSVNQSTAKIPEILSSNFEDIGSYALQYAVNQVNTGEITSSIVVDYSEFDVLDGSINSIEYIFTTTGAKEEGNDLFAGKHLVINGKNIKLPSGHCNGDLIIGGENITASGTFSYCGTADVEGDIDIEKTTPKPEPSLPKTLDELKDMAISGGTYFNSDVKLWMQSGNQIRVEGPDKDIPDGSIIYVENGKIEIFESGFNRTVTLVSTGVGIVVNAENVTLNPAVEGILMFSSGDVEINGLGFTLNGIIQAKGDKLTMNGSSGSVFTGALWVSNLLQINGDGLQLICESGGAGEAEEAIVTQVEIISNISMNVQDQTFTHSGSAVLKTPEASTELKIIYWNPCSSTD